MKTTKKNAMFAAILALALMPASAFASCYANYCANSSSPVVGGGYNGAFSCLQKNSSPGTCILWGMKYTPFGNVAYSGSTDSYTDPDSTDGEQNIECPADTAQLATPNGGSYVADNGVSYGGNVILCVQTDTFP